MQEVPIAAQSPDRFKAVLTDAQWSDLLATIERARRMIDARVIWNVNSTARGGGVAELLQSLVAYVRGAGFDCRWTVAAGSPDFFAVTKRLHNRLHGAAGDGGPLGERERAIYERTSAENARALLAGRARGGPRAAARSRRPPAWSARSSSVARR